MRWNSIFNLSKALGFRLIKKITDAEKNSFDPTGIRTLDLNRIRIGWADCEGCVIPLDHWAAKRQYWLLSKYEYKPLLVDHNRMRAFLVLSWSHFQFRK